MLMILKVIILTSKLVLVLRYRMSTGLPIDQTDWMKNVPTSVLNGTRGMITHVKNHFISYVNMTSSNNNFHNHDRGMGI